MNEEVLKMLIEFNYPLLKEFKDLCPGTVKHSQNMAFILENVCINLNIDPLPLKVATMYHDVGKMFNPKYFIENQEEEINIHESLNPQISYQIISRHVSDTAIILLGDKNFPIEIIDIAVQHHGTSIVKYFFSKSREENPNEYRYKTPKPKNICAALLMIADHIEARIKSESLKKIKHNYDEIVNDIIYDLWKDGQLDNVYMKLGDMKLIKQYFIKELDGSFHKRSGEFYYDEKTNEINN